MDLELNQLQSKARNVALDARALSRLVESDAFKAAWCSASPEQRQQVMTHLARVDKCAVDRWVKSVASAASLEGKSARELRAIATAAGVMYVNEKTKDELVAEIRREQDDLGVAG